MPKIGKKTTVPTDKKKTETKKVESLSVVPKSPSEKKGTVTVPTKKEEEKKAKKLPIDSQ